MPGGPRVKQGAQCFIAGKIPGGGGQSGAGAAVKGRAPGHIAGLCQKCGLLGSQCVKACLHRVKQLAGNDPVKGMPQRAGAAVGGGDAVAQMRGAVPHDALYTEQHRQTGGLGSLGHGGGRVILGAPDVDKIGPQPLQQRGKGGGAGHNTVVHAICAAGCLCFADAQHGQMQRRVRLQRGKLPGQPAAAHIAGTGQPAGGRRLRQRGFDKPEDLHLYPPQKFICNILRCKFRVECGNLGKGQAAAADLVQPAAKR